MKETIKKVNFFITASVKDGFSCDCCGQAIKNVYDIEFSNGVRIHLGVDCFKNQYTKRLTDYGKREYEKILKDIRFYADQQKTWETMNEAEMPEGDRYRLTDVDDYWYGKTFEEYKAWMLSDWFPQRFKDIQKKIEKFKFNQVKFDIPELTVNN